MPQDSGTTQPPLPLIYGALPVFTPIIMSLRPQITVSLFLLGASFLVSSVAYADTQIPPERIVTDSSPYFEVAGTERVSVYRVGELGREAVHICEKYLDLLPPNFPQRITVLLDPNDSAVSGAEGFDLTIEEGGFLTLRIQWNADTELHTVCHAMTEALLVRAVYYRYGRSAVDQMSAWVIAGLAEKLFLRLRPSLIESYKGQFQALETTDMNRAMRAKRGSECDSITAYALVEAIDTLIPKHATASQILEAALVGVSVEKELKLLQSEINPANPDTSWWEAGVEALHRRSGGSVDSMEESRQWLEALASMAAFPDALNIRNLRELGMQRVDAEVQALIAERQRAILNGMLRVNPLYYNTAQSLGRFYEQILFGEPGFRRTRTLIDYLNDWNAALRMQALAERALNDPKAKDQ